MCIYKRYRPVSSMMQRQIRLFRDGLWCGRRDLNPYSLQNTPLKRARMPIPPRPRVWGCQRRRTILYKKLNVLSTCKFAVEAGSTVKFAVAKRLLRVYHGAGVYSGGKMGYNSRVYVRDDGKRPAGSRKASRGLVKARTAKRMGNHPGAAG